jgi:hypothetical protein
VAAIIVIIVLLAVAVGGYAVWRNSRRALPPGQRHGAIPPGQRPPPNPQHFTPLPPQAGGGSFVEQRRTKPGTPPATPRPGGRGGTTNSFGTVYVNPTAICKLTGKQVADCTCHRCAKLRKV